jgi:hypothetical protein
MPSHCELYPLAGSNAKMPTMALGAAYIAPHGLLCVKDPLPAVDFRNSVNSALLSRCWPSTFAFPVPFAA